MNRTTEIELKEILEQLKQNPEDLDLLNLAAIGCFQNPKYNSDNQALSYFQNAYELNKSVKTCHNLAWFLYFEYSEIEWRDKNVGSKEEALLIQEYCLKLSPSSFYPYLQLGYMHLQSKKYDDAINYLEIAYSKTKDRRVIHNLGYCEFQIDKFKDASKYFRESSQIYDLEYRSLYNLALCEYLQGNINEVHSIISELESPDESKCKMDVEISELYYLLGDYEAAANSTLKYGLNYIELLQWNCLAYAVYQKDKSIVMSEAQKGIKQRESHIQEIDSNHSDWSDWSVSALKERRIELKEEIEFLENTEERFMKIPKLDPKEMILIESCGCLMFGCKQHGNLKNDE